MLHALNMYVNVCIPWSVSSNICIHICLANVAAAAAVAANKTRCTVYKRQYM